MRCKGVCCVDLDESFQMSIYLHRSASIQKRTSPVKFALSPCTGLPGSTKWIRSFTPKPGKFSGNFHENSGPLSLRSSLNTTYTPCEIPCGGCLHSSAVGFVFAARLQRNLIYSYQEMKEQAQGSLLCRSWQVRRHDSCTGLSVFRSLSVLIGICE